MSDARRFDLPEDDRKGIALVMDVILPGTDMLPSAGDIRAHDELLDRVLNADPTLAPLVSRAASRALEGPFDFESLRQWMGDDIERLVFAVQAAYYMSADVRTRLGYPGQRPVPVSLATPDQLCSDDLIAPVVARGPIYVPTPN